MVIRRFWNPVRVMLLVCVMAVAWAGASAQSRGDDGPGGLAVLGKITAPSARPRRGMSKRCWRPRAERRARVVILELDTPGGLSTSMRQIITAILGSDIPVIGYVAPAGAHAASAGTYILYATGLAAMAPGTNLGAATPISLGVGDDKSGSTLHHKVVNDAVAEIRALAEMHGRNADWAEKAVREAATLTATQARKQGVIDLMADNISDLLAQADGRSVVTGLGKRVLHTRNLRVERVEPGYLAEILAIIGNPNIAFILMLVGVYGLVFEFANPGTIGPGVIGAICLVLGLYSLNQLPLDYAGLALLLLGIGLMVAEAFTPTFGVLGAGGLIAFVFGAAMLVDSDRPEFQLSWTVIGGTALLSGALLVLMLGYVWRSQRSRVVTGREELQGAEARVVDWANGSGAVWVRGERWRARGPEGLKAGDTVRIAQIEGLTLVVQAHPAPAR